MNEQAIQMELINVVGGLGSLQQRQVLDFARFLKSNSTLPPGTPGRDFLEFAGSVSETDARLMEEAVEEGRRVDPNEW